MMNPAELRAFLSKWPDAWKHPDIWRALETDDLEPIRLGRAYLEYLANPAEPLRILLTLIDEGAFSAAEALMRNEVFLERVGVDLTAHQDSIRLDLTRRAVMAEASTVASIEELIGRSRLAGAPISRDHTALHEAAKWAGRDTRKADEALAPLRQLVQEAEAKHLANLRSTIDWNNKSDEWSAAMHRALAANDLELAHALISGASERNDVELSSLLLPRLAPGPFGRKDPANICRWSLDGRGGPPEFYAKWDPLRISSFPREVLEALFIVCKGDDVQAEHVSALLAGIEKLLGVTTFSSPQITVEGEYYRGVLRGLKDEACAAFRDGAIALYIRRHREDNKSVAPKSYARPEVILSIDGDHGAPYVVLTPWDLHRCFSKPSDFKENLLRILCAQLTADEFMPDAHHAPDEWMQRGRDAEPALIQFAALRSFAARVLDLAGRWVESPRVLDRLAFYSSGRAPLLYALLYAVLKEAEERGIPRRALIDADCLDSSYCSPGVRNAIKRVLVDPIEREPLLAVVLAALLIAVEPDPQAATWGESTRGEEVHAWLEIEDIHISAEQFAEAIEQLRALHIVETSSDGRISLSRAGGGYLLPSLLGRYGYFPTAKQLLSDVRPSC